MRPKAELHSAADAIDAIHEGTALYTCPPEIEKLIDQLGWPDCGGTMIDPGCGDGNMIIAALARLAPAPGDWQAIKRVNGIEFHTPSAEEARDRCKSLLKELGWNETQAREASLRIIQNRDFLFDPVPGSYDIILANPPYWRRNRLPEAYRTYFDEIVAAHARGDLLHAYLDRMLSILAPGGTMALVTSDRWLVNSGAARLRQLLGKTLRVSHAERLDSSSVFHRPKNRTKGSPPRVHAVSLLLGSNGRTLSKDPFLVDQPPKVDGVLFHELVDIRLAPWLGPDGIFMVDSAEKIPGAKVAPCILPRGIDTVTGEVLPTTRWAIITGDDKPPTAVLDHLMGQMDRMPDRGRKTVLWQPPERFDKHLPLNTEAVLIPRIAKRLRPIVIPAGHLPVNHSLVIASGQPAQVIKAMLEHPLVQKQADALAPRVESGYRSYTATLLRALVIPYEAVPEKLDKAA